MTSASIGVMRVARREGAIEATAVSVAAAMTITAISTHGTVGNTIPGDPGMLPIRDCAPAQP